MKLCRQLLVILAILAAIVSIILFYSKESIDQRLKIEVIRFWDKEVGPSLGLALKSIEWKDDWNNVLKGRVSKLNLTLVPTDKSIKSKMELSGAFELGLDGLTVLDLIKGKIQQKITIFYEPTIKITHLDKSYLGNLGAQVRLSSLKQKIEEVHLNVDFPTIAFGNAALTQFNTGVHFASEKIVVIVKADSLSIESTDPEISAETKGLFFQAAGSIDNNFSKMGNQIDATVKINSAEILRGEEYYDLTKIPIELAMTTHDKPEKIESPPENGSVLLSLAGKQVARFEINSLFSSNSGVDRIRVQSEIKNISIPWAIKLIETAIPELPSMPVDIPKGALTFKNEISMLKSAKILANRSHLSLTDISLKMAEYPVFLDGINAEFDLDQFKKTKSWLNIDRIWLKRLPIDFKKLDIGISPHLEINSTKDQPNSFSFEVSQIKLSNPNGVEILFNSLKGKLPSLSAHLSSTFKIKNLPILSKDFCITSNWMPDALIDGNFQEIRFAKSSLNTKGNIRVGLFEGLAEISGVNLYYLSSPLPEYQASLMIKDIDLQSFGNWMGFGEMDGTLQGYANDILIQGTRPTEFDFKLEVVPKKENQIVFSPKAMKNVVQLLAGEDLNQALPGIANWIAFGWPSAFFGGYNIYYTGISLFAKDGSILLTTLDPDDIFRKENKHYFLFGPRFKIPIKSSRYPVVLDGPGMHSFVQHMIGQFENLKKQQEFETIQEVGEIDEVITICIPDHWQKNENSSEK